MIDEIVHPARTQAHASFPLAPHSWTLRTILYHPYSRISVTTHSILILRHAPWAEIGRHATTKASCFRDARPHSLSTSRQGPRFRPVAFIRSLAARQPRGASSVSVGPCRSRSPLASALRARRRPWYPRMQLRLEKRVYAWIARVCYAPAPRNRHTAASVGAVRAPVFRSRNAAHSRVRRAPSPSLFHAVIRSPGLCRTRA